MDFNNNWMRPAHIHARYRFMADNPAHHILTTLEGSSLTASSPKIQSKENQSNHEKHCTYADKADQEGKALFWINRPSTCGYSAHSKKYEA